MMTEIIMEGNFDFLTGFIVFFHVWKISSLEVYDGCKFQDIFMESGLMRITISKRRAGTDCVGCFVAMFSFKVLHLDQPPR